MSSVFTEIAVILLLLVGNGMFAMTEIALVSARKARLRKLADEGDSRARVALELVESPNRFLSTVQIGITLVGIFAGAFGGATIAEHLEEGLRPLPYIGPYAGVVAVAVVVLGITYCSLIIGELVPKRLALGAPEKIALRLARPMQRLSRLAGPLVSLLSSSTEGVTRLLGVKAPKEPPVSEEELKLLLREGVRAGVFHESEPRLVEGVLALDQLRVKDLMTPRGKIIWLNLADSHEAIWHKIVVSGHTTFPVYEGDRDHIVGMVSVKAIYANLAAGQAVRIRDLMVAPMLVPASQTAVGLLEAFRKARRFVAVVVDEFGGVTGVVSLHDVMEAVLGDLPSQDERGQPTAVRRPDGSWLVDGMLTAEKFLQLVSGFPLDPPGAREYQTLGGFIFSQLGRVPVEGETFEHRGFRVEVIDMDGNRVDKVLLIPTQPVPAPPSSPEAGHTGGATSQTPGARS